MPPRQGRSRNRQIEDLALVVRRFPYGETSLVVHLFTRTHGRVAAIAKGAYRLKSGYFGVLDLFDTLRVTWKGAGGDLGVLASAAIERRRRLTVDLPRYHVGLAILELASLGAREGQPDPRLFDLAAAHLDLVHGGAVEPELVATVFELGFLRSQGLTPALEGCAACGSQAPGAAPRVPFSTAQGGRLCSACAAEFRSSGRRVDTLPLGTLRIAHSLMNTETDMLPRTKVPAEALHRVRAMVQSFLEYHLETRSHIRRLYRTRGRGAGSARRFANR